METAQLAIEYTLLCKDRKLSIEILVKKIESLGLSCSKIEHQAKGICIDLSEEIGFYLFLFDVGNIRIMLGKQYFLQRILHLKGLCNFEWIRDISILRSDMVSC